MCTKASRFTVGNQASNGMSVTLSGTLHKQEPLRTLSPEAHGKEPLARIAYQTDDPPCSVPGAVGVGHFDNRVVRMARGEEYIHPSVATAALKVALGRCRNLSNHLLGMTVLYQSTDSAWVIAVAKNNAGETISRTWYSRFCLGSTVIGRPRVV